MLAKPVSNSEPTQPTDVKWTKFLVCSGTGGATKSSVPSWQNSLIILTQSWNAKIGDIEISNVKVFEDLYWL